MGFNEFISTNGAFVLTFTGMVGACCAGILICILKSRCERIKCCGIECDRRVISEANLNNVTIAA